MNVYERSLILGLIFSVLFSIVNFSAECNKISDKVLRLHIIANSDSAEDQELKLKVRNSIMNFLSGKNFESLEETKDFILSHENELEILSQNEVINSGFNYKVSAKVCRSRFSTRVYENISLPAGEYDSLKIVIGNGKGKNWWCVIFPPMCVPTAEDCSINNECYENHFSNNEKNVIENEVKYKVKFKIVEILEILHECICNLVNHVFSFFSDL